MKSHVKQNHNLHNILCNVTYIQIKINVYSIIIEKGGLPSPQVTLVMAFKGLLPLKELAMLLITVLSLAGWGINLEISQTIVVSVNLITQARLTQQLSVVDFHATMLGLFAVLVVVLMVEDTITIPTRLSEAVTESFLWTFTFQVCVTKIAFK